MFVLILYSRTESRIVLEYANQRVDDSSTQFYVRELPIAFTNSVLPTIQCISLTLLPIIGLHTAEKQRHLRHMSITSIGKAMAISEDLEDNLRDADSDDECLLILEAKNASARQTFEVVLEVKEGLHGRIKQKIDPGATANLLVPVSRIQLSEELIKQPIPALLEKQFVVGKDTTSKLERELFWYREQLLKVLKLSWREIGTRRMGEISLRSLALSEEMLPVLKKEDLTLDVVLADCDSGKSLECLDTGEWCAHCGSFVEVQVKATNRRGGSDVP